MTGAGKQSSEGEGEPSAQTLFHEAVRLGELGRPGEALACYDRALTLAPAHPGLLFNRGVVLGDLDRHAEALDSFDRALAVQPAFAEAWNNRGFTLQQLKRPQEALHSFDRALALQPEFADALVNRGVALRDLRRPAEALAALDRALAVAPDAPHAWNSRGFLLQQLGRLDEAALSFRRALALWPDYAEAELNLAAALLESGQAEAAFAIWRIQAEATYPDPGDVPAHQAQHDREQLAHLKASGEGGAAGFRICGGERLSRPAVSPRIAADGVCRKWAGDNPKVVVIDNLLTDEALQALRRFCLGSTIWRRAYDGGYLGAMPEQGFAVPLLAQIAEELRDALPPILAPHALRYLWAFKYDSRLNGINVHADRAAVNVNFWITPDAANLDPASGGLVVWDLEAPLDWDYETYNADPDAIRGFLEQEGARRITIPYRANRAVIFDSDLFHQTDEIRFADGYDNRRINVTMLYGRRSADNR